MHLISGGTIIRASGISRVFGHLDLTTVWFLALGPEATAMKGFGGYALSALLNLPNMGSGNVLTFWSDLTSAIKKCSPFFLRPLFHFKWERRPERLHYHGHCRTGDMRRRRLVLMVTAGPRLRLRGSHLRRTPSRVPLFVLMIRRVEKSSCLMQ
jgi:hypothetical protein